MSVPKKNIFEYDGEEFNKKLDEIFSNTDKKELKQILIECGLETKERNTIEKTADEMFEELGYKKEEQKNEYVTYIWYYQRNGANEEFGIEFSKSIYEEQGEIYCVCHSEREEAIYINMQELQAINKKVEELGWEK